MNKNLSFKIKSAKRKDYKEIAKIYIDSFSKPPYNEPWTSKKAINKIKISSKYCDLLKIKKNSEIIGFIIINPNHWFPGKFCFIEEFAIKKESRNKKIGTNAIKFIEKEYKKKGFEYIMGLTNKEAESFKFWKRLGLVENKHDKLVSKKLTK